MGSCSPCKRPSPNFSQEKNTTQNPININVKISENYYNNKNSSFNNNNDINTLNKRYNDIKIKNKIFYDDIEEQEGYLENYKKFISELNYQINDLKDHLNISLCEEKYYENLLNQKENEELLNEIEIISNKINEFNNLLETQKIELKYLENNYQMIQDEFNKMKKDPENASDFKDNIEQLFSQSELISKNLYYYKTLYEQKKIDIENDIRAIQFITQEKVTFIKKKGKKNLKNIYLTKFKNNFSSNYDLLNDSLFLKGSMLFGIKDFGKIDDVFKSIYVFKQNENDDLYEMHTLLMKNYHVTCYINDDYDLYDINYDLKAVGLLEDMFFNSGSFGFPIDTHIEIVLFEIDGIKTNFNFEKYCLRFDIKLKNLESNKIHIIYKESPLMEKMTENEKRIRSLYRIKYYGISKRFVGQSAKFILINKSNFEIINFGDEFFIKNNNNEYQWGGKVPENGKETTVRMSKKEGRIIFSETHEINTLDKKFIKRSIIKIPFCYMNGNNKILEYLYYSKQTKKIIRDNNKKIFEVHYINLNTTKAEFIIKGDLINRCKGEWIINLSNEEIESLVPPDFKTNKEYFKKISHQIIKQYDEEHKDDLVVVPTVTKIGKWVKKNIKYDVTYIGLNDITATETYNLKKGVCHHMTKLFNALMYSLGYQVIYTLGYALNKKTHFAIEDAHAWSLIKINGKWLPFDATWGIFSGKLPVTHVFKQPDFKNVESLCYDKVKIEQIKVKGNIY